MGADTSILLPRQAAFCTTTSSWPEVTMARSVRLRRTPPVFRHISPDLYITLEFRQGYCENRPVLRQKQSISPGEGRPFSCAGGTRPEHDELMRSASDAA